MLINPADYPPGFAEYAQPLLNARVRTLKMMTEHEKVICRYILKAFPELGRGPYCDEIATGADLPVDQVSDCLKRLDEIDMLKYDSETQQVLVLYPLSSIPCPHQVLLKGKKPVYAM